MTRQCRQWEGIVSVSRMSRDLCVSQRIVNPISYVEYLSSISWYSTCRKLQYPRHGCYDLNTSVIIPSLQIYIFSTPLTRNIFSICVTHHRWRSLISCILSVLYVWITFYDKKYQSFLISSGHNFHDISSLLSFTVQTNYHQPWGIDNFTLQLSSYPFFFSIRCHSIRFICTFYKKAAFSDKDLSKYYWISWSFRFHPMKLWENLMSHFLV